MGIIIATKDTVKEYIKNGEEGSYVYNDENDRMIVSLGTVENHCICSEYCMRQTDKFREKNWISLEQAVQFLYGEIEFEELVQPW